MKTRFAKWKPAIRQALLTVLIFLLLAAFTGLVILKIYYLIKLWTE
jgi:hypothetical protein